MSAPNATLLEQVRAAVDAARDSGAPTPGRKTLAKLTGATEYAVRQALATLAAELVPVPVQPPQDAPEWVAEADGSDEAGGASVPTLVAPDVPSAPADGLTAPAPAVPASTPTVHPRVPRPWPLLLIGLGAAVAVWSGWVGLGELTGFGVVRLLPGIWDSLRLNSAVVLPLSVEAYGGYALRCWLHSAGLSERTRTFARRSAFASLAIGAAAQVIYHLLAAAGVHTAPWPVTVLVACVPVVTLGLATGLAALVKHDSAGGDQP